LGEGQIVQVVVTSINDPKAPTLQGQINSLSSSANSFRLISYPYLSKLAGLPAYVLVYSGSGIWRLGGGLETDLEIFTIDQQGTLYSIVYTASPDLFSRYLPVAIGMIKTFALTGVPASESGYSSPLLLSSNQPSSQSGYSSSIQGSSACPTPGPGGCAGAFSTNSGSAFSPLNPHFGETPLQQNIPEYDPNRIPP
jgi:hypothetical protein